MIWYLIIFGYAYHTSLKVQEPSRAVCIQQAQAYDDWMRSTRDLLPKEAANAFCVEGLKEESVHNGPA